MALFKEFRKTVVITGCQSTRLVAFCAVCCALFYASPCIADRLHHADGSVIEGEIVSETTDNIQIKTRYGTLNYERGDIQRVEKSSSVAPAATSMPATRQNLMELIPRGPINVKQPPVVPALVRYGPAPTTSTLTAQTTATATPGTQ